jgi:aspartyl-tRNA(Asn)/glutamyl-tRNA(Gln) amidotransferase subunit A
LDTVGAITRDVNQAIAVHQVLSGQAVAHWAKPVSHLRLGIPSHVHLDDLDAGVGIAWENTLRTLRQAGITLVEVATPALADVLACQSSAPLVAVEAYAFHRNNLKAPGVTFDPRVKTRIETAANVSAADYWDLLSARKRLAVQLAPALQGVDAMISPTVPMVAPALADLAPGAAHEEAYLRVNRLLLRNPSTVNFLDGCAITIPCQEPGQLPVGLMLWQLHGHDSAILGIAKQLNDQAQ